MANLCACGCGRPLVSVDGRGRCRRFIHGHNGKKEGTTERQAERRRRYARSWYYKNYERLSERRKQQREVLKQRWKRYYKSCRHDLITKAHHRNRQRAFAPGSHTTEQWLARVTLHGWRCRYCGRSLSSSSLVKEHAIPISRGGANWPANLVPSCALCNSKKRNKTLLEFIT